MKIYWLALWSICLLSAAGYQYAGFQLGSSPGQTAVLNFLALFGTLFLLYALAVSFCGRIFRRSNSQEKFLLVSIFLAAIVFRVLLLPAGISEGVSWPRIKQDLNGEAVVFDRFLLYDHDVWRYLWDGHQQAAGLNPYLYPPMALEPYSDSLAEISALAKPEFAKPELAERLFPNDHWRDIWDYINYKEIPTVYPPLLQWAFRISHAISPGSVLVWKLLLLICDLLLCGVLLWLLKELKQPSYYLSLYAWNPLVIKETFGSGHADVIPALLIALSLLAFIKRREYLGVGALALAALAKLTPLVLAPLVWRRTCWRAKIAGIILVIAGFLPYVGTGKGIWQGLSTYTRDWIFNPGIFELIRWISIKTAPALNPSLPAKLFCGIAFLVLLGYLTYLPAPAPLDLVKRWLFALGGLIFFSAAIMPWYFVWLLPLAALCRARAWFIYSALLLLSYWVYIRGDGIEEPWRLALTHLGFLIALAVELRSNKL